MIGDELPELEDDGTPRELGEATMAVVRVLTATAHEGAPTGLDETRTALAAIEDRATLDARAGDELGALAVLVVVELRVVLELLEEGELRRACRRFAAITRHRLGIRGPLGPDWRRIPPSTEGDHP